MAEKHHAHAGESTIGPHGGTDVHGQAHGHDDHGHGPEALGPVNVQMWAAGVVGILLGLVVMFAFIQAAG